VNPAESELIAKIAEGSEEAFEYIFLSYYNDLCYYAASIIHDRVLAEEVVQDCFVSFWETRANHLILKSLKHYLFRSVHNKCINLIAQNNLHKSHFENIKREYLLPSSPYAESYPISDLISGELNDKIDQIINSLPDQCRSVFLKVRMEDASYAEAAEALGLSINTIKTQLSRAIQKLRQGLKEYLP
jgi:RNA polymerase sigma-70 factor (family 1)